MKTRSGFVSNSSTTSFCIYGITCRSNILEDLLQTEDFVNVLDDLFPFNGDIRYWINFYDSNVWIGKSFLKMEQDETRKEFESKVLNELKEKLGDKVIECCTIGSFKEAWYDG